MKFIKIVVFSLICICYYSSCFCQSSDEFSERGFSKLASSNYTGAIADFNKSIELDPTDAISYNFRGVAKSSLNDHRGAILDYNMAIKLFQIYEAAYYNRGYSKVIIRDDEGAMEDYNHAIYLNPKYKLAYLNRGLLKCILGQKHDGCLDLSKAGELGSNEAYKLIEKYCN